MKILQVIPFFSPRFGGSVSVLYNLSKELVKRNHEVTIITTDFGLDRQYANSMRANGVIVIPLRCIANIDFFLYTPPLKYWLKNNLKEYDIIHLHNFRSYQNVMVHKYATKCGIPIIMQAHGSVLPFFEKRIQKKLYDYIWGSKILTDSSKCLAVSKVERDQYLTMGSPENKIEIIPNGINVEDYEILPERGNFRKKYGIASDEKIILYLGRLHKSKGIDFLINSFFSLLDQYPNAKFVIAGPDEGFLDVLMNQIKKLKINEKILVTGHLYKNEKIEAFVDADVLIYPGRIEIFGLVPFEAIMCGTPVIVADGCGCGEVIREAQCGYLVHYGDIYGLNKTILKVIENPESTKKMVDSGKLYIQENLAWDDVVKQVERLYENLRNSIDYSCYSS